MTDDITIDGIRAFQMKNILGSPCSLQFSINETENLYRTVLLYTWGEQETSATSMWFVYLRSGGPHIRNESRKLNMNHRETLEYLSVLWMD